MAVFINSVTNNATVNQTASTAAITNALAREQAAITNAIAQGGDSSLLTNLNQTMGGISNLLFFMGQNFTNGSMTASNNWQSPTNRATESTLAKIWGAIWGSLTNQYYTTGVGQFGVLSNVAPTGTDSGAATAATTSLFAGPLGVLSDFIASFSVPVVSESAIDARCSASASVNRNVILIRGQAVFSGLVVSQSHNPKLCRRLRKFPPASLFLCVFYPHAGRLNRRPSLQFYLCDS